MLSPAILGGLFIGTLSALPIVNVANCCCLWIVAGGALAAHLQQQGETQPIGAARGALVGVRAGVVGAVVWLIVTIALDPLVSPLQQRLVNQMLSSASDMPPDVRTFFESVGNRASAPARMVLGFFSQLFIGTGFSALGGLIAATFFSSPGGTDGDIVPPPLPPV